MTGFKTLARLTKEFGMEAVVGFSRIMYRLMFPVEKKPVVNAKWWQRPGLGIMYQIEYRPGMEWQRDFAEFNKKMMDSSGNLKFNGPFCKVDKWVELSKKVGADYHIMEAKWHDGICYFNTKTTSWKTETDYAGQFAELSRKAQIPFMYYYSAIFDHNPQFDPIQPNLHSTFSVIAADRQPIYEGYLSEQYREIAEQYRPDGMWIDWIWPDRSTEATIEFFRKNYPDLVLTFNASNYFTRSHNRLDYTTGEAHDLDGPYIKLVKSEGAYLPIFCSAWKWATLGRRILNHPSELITPAGKWWSDPTLRDDPNDIIRMAAIVMASGGKFCIGVAEQLNGGIYPDQIRQMELLGDWYVPRKGLFADSVPLRYRGREPGGVTTHPTGFKAIPCRFGADIMLHLINMDGATKPVKIQLKGNPWENINAIVMEPSGRELSIEKSGRKTEIVIKENIDPVDIILRLKF